MLFFDGINHPDAATVAADGLDGGMLYLGTPTSGKDLTAAQYADYKAHGLRTIVGFEHVVDDWRGGAAAGRANGTALLADAKAKHVEVDDPFWVAGADQHVTAVNLPTVVTYVRAYVATVRAGGWRGPAGGYGFPEVTTALHSAGVVDWYWGAGRRADQPAWINIWQDNTQTIVVGGSTDDEDWVLIPIPSEETTMNADFDSSDASPDPGTYGHDVLNLRQQFVVNGANQVPVITAALAAIQKTQTVQTAAITTLSQAVAAQHGLTLADIKATFDAELAKIVHVQVDVTGPTTTQGASQ